jgi:hypothetical protein
LHQSTLFLQLPLPIWLEIKHYNKLNGNVTVYYINSKNHFLLDSAKQKIIKNIVTSAEKRLHFVGNPGYIKEAPKNLELLLYIRLLKTLKIHNIFSNF